MKYNEFRERRSKSDSGKLTAVKTWTFCIASASSPQEGQKWADADAAHLRLRLEHTSLLHRILKAKPKDEALPRYNDVFSY